MLRKKSVMVVLALVIFAIVIAGCEKPIEQKVEKPIEQKVEKPDEQEVEIPIEGSQPQKVSKTDYKKGEPAPLPKEGVEMPRFLVFKGGFGTGLQLDLDTEATLKGIREIYPDINIRIMPGGSKEGVDRVAAEECDMGVAGPDYPYWYWVGDMRGGYTEPNPEKVYCIFNIPSGMKLTWVVNEKSDIYTVADLKDKRINVAGPGTAAESTYFPGILKAEGLSYDIIESNGGLIHRGNMQDAMEMLSAGQLDAVATSQPHPSALLEEYSITRNARLISLTDGQLEEALNPITGTIGYVPGVISKSEYEWLSEDIKAGNMVDTVTVSVDMPNDVVYNFLCAIWGNDMYKEWGNIHPSMKNIEYLDKALEGLGSPLHPGAIEFWEDWGFEIPKNYTEVEGE